MSTPGQSTEWWTIPDIAAFLGLSVHTVSSYRSRGQMPAPEQTIGRTPVWRPSTIREWHAARPGHGDRRRQPTRLAEPRRPDVSAEWWTIPDIAAFLGVADKTVSAYRSRGTMPAPEQTIGRTPVWRPSTIREWHAARPGHGGRPAGTSQRPEAERVV